MCYGIMQFVCNKEKDCNHIRKKLTLLEIKNGKEH